MAPCLWMDAAPVSGGEVHTSSLFQRSEKEYCTRQPCILDREVTSPVHGDTYHPNVVLFGETGVGKSSLINLIADEHLAQTSNGALGCTAQHQRHNVTLTPPLSHDTSGPGPGPEPVIISLWDTAGLDEGTRGTVPASLSTAHLTSLLHSLARSPAGIHLLLFCIRGTTRLTRDLKRHCDLVHAKVCRKKVRIVLVVTGLEYQYLERQGGMECWWEENEDTVRRLGLAFDEHACVTTVEVKEGERRLASQRRLRELVVRLTRPDKTPWKIGPSWWQSMGMQIFCNPIRVQRSVEASAYRAYVALKQSIETENHQRRGENVVETEGLAIRNCS